MLYSFVIGALGFVGGHVMAQYASETQCIGKYLLNQFSQAVYAYQAKTTLTRVGMHDYNLAYTYKGIQYVIFLRFKKGPRRVESVKDMDGNDVSDQVVPYLGPDESCHHQPITPANIGFPELHVTLLDGTVNSFGEDDIISI